MRPWNMSIFSTLMKVNDVLIKTVLHFLPSVLRRVWKGRFVILLRTMIFLWKDIKMADFQEIYLNSFTPKILVPTWRIIFKMANEWTAVLLNLTRIFVLKDWTGQPRIFRKLLPTFETRRELLKYSGWKSIKNKLLPRWLGFVFNFNFILGHSLFYIWQQSAFL